MGTQTTGVSSIDQTDAVTFIIDCWYGTIPHDYNNSVLVQMSSLQRAKIYHHWSTGKPQDVRAYLIDVLKSL